MAAYAALTSLNFIIETIENHPHPPISLDKSQVESLTAIVSVLQNFLEIYSHVDLEMRIADASHAAEDVIETHIVDQIHAGSTSTQGKAFESHIADQIHVGSTSTQGKAFESHIADQIHAGSTSPDKTIRCFDCFRGLHKARSRDKKMIGSVDLQKVIRGMDLTESPVVDQIDHAGSVDLHEALDKVIQEMDRIKREVMEIMANTQGEADLMHKQSTPASSVRSSSTRQNVVVGLDDVLIAFMDKLTDGLLDRRIIPVVGMGGSGKTTLAKKVYQNKAVVQRFDLLVWVTISQEYRAREILVEFFQGESRQSLIELSEYELGVRVHKRLSGRRYLIVLDDIWDIQVWDQLGQFFPDNNNGSRVVLTTRISELAYQVANSNVIKIGFLDEDNSWDLFCKIVFGEEGCPFKLEGIGKKIVRNCKGLPLSIVVVGGLLVKTEHNQEKWERIGGNLSSVVNLEDDGSCLKILHMSYSQLPVYLKPCFLYMGVFPEDYEIRVSSLVKLWVAEGFLKPISGKSMEIVAEEYLKNLIDRNLILIHRLGHTGAIKSCKIHDLLRDFCLKEAHKERFYNVTGQHSVPQCINNQRRIVILDGTSRKEFGALKTDSCARSLIWDSDEKLPSLDFRLLRIVKAYGYPHLGVVYFGKNIFEFVNSRYIAIRVDSSFHFASSVHLLWNVQTLIVECWYRLTAPSEIWNMPQLRHIEFPNSVLFLPDPPNGGQADEDGVLVNLQKLTGVIDLKFGEETIRRIPNVTSLKVSYPFFRYESSEYCFDNLERLHKLESLKCFFIYERPTIPLPGLSFPHSLQKLDLKFPHFKHWDDIVGKIGLLPILEKLRLINGSFRGHKWETVEGQFERLKYLEILECRELEYWTTDSTHFPRLEHLCLCELINLKGIPLEIGDIPTLQLIEVMWCSDSVEISAREILREQKELENEGLQVEIMQGPASAKKERVVED